MSWYYRVLVIAAAAGFIGTATWHVLTLLGVEVPRDVWMPLSVGVFIVWFPAVVATLSVKDRIAADRRNMWKIALEGAPTWLCLAALYIAIYATINFILATGGFGSVTDKDPAFPRAGSGIDMIFYVTAMALLYAAGVREHAVRCPEGHLIYPGQDFCAVCGQLPAQNQPSAQGGPPAV